jgi:alcohol dehydrogenase YqhD (iron-dependent ADH family)
MENFVMHNPVKLHFGNDSTGNLGKSIKKYGSKVLLVYGGGSIKRNGIYDDVITQLRKAGVEWVEYQGIRPNPIVEDVDAAAAVGRENDVDVVLAVGGGSVIDSAKFISLAIPVDHTAWKFPTDEVKPRTAVPLICVLTLAATGTEMNRFAVIQNNATNEKLGWGNMLIYPKESFLDPSYTITVPKDYTGYGIVDLTAHALEAYFGEGEATLSDRFVFAIINEAKKYGELLMDDLSNYSLREKIMYAATCALNNLTIYGRKNGDWGVHSLGHVLSVLYDVPHGASLSIVYPAWLRFHKEKLADRISELGMNLFGTTEVDETIFQLENFFASVESPIRLSDVGIGEDEKKTILKVMEQNDAGGNHMKLDNAAREHILSLMYRTTGQ